MRVAVLGGTGFIGEHVTRWLVVTGQEVIGIHRGLTPVRVPGVRSLTADRQNPPALAGALADVAPTVLVDLIAYLAADVTSLLTVLPPSVERLVLISSGDVYWTYDAFRGLSPAPGPVSPLSETAPLRERLYPYRAQAEGPDDLRYWYEKILVEQAARTGARVPVTILRLPMVYGPGDRQQRVGGYLKRLRSDSSVLRLNAAEACWRCTRGYVEDVAWAIALAASDDRATGELFNVGETEALTELEWASAIAATAGWSGRIVADPSTPPSLPAEWSVHLVMESRRLRDALGYEEPVGRPEGLRRTVRGIEAGTPRPGTG